jgi:multidrug transporter EmrE-like cation transporter
LGIICANLNELGVSAALKLTYFRWRMPYMRIVSCNIILVFVFAFSLKHVKIATQHHLLAS